MNPMELKHSLLNDTSLTKLRNCGIISIKPFLDTDEKLLARLIQLTEQHVAIIKNHFRTMYEFYLPVQESEYEEIIRRNFKENQIFQTGVPALDKRIKGMTLGSLIEVVGDPEIGKTKLCMSIAINILTRYEKESYWIDTKTDFSPIGMEREMRVKYEWKTENSMINAMKNIHVIRTFTLEGVIGVLEHMIEDESIHSGLLVLDSLSSILCEYVGKRYKVGEEGLKKISNYVRNLCAKKKFIAVVTLIPRQEKQKAKTDQIKSPLQDYASERLFIRRAETQKVQNVEVRNSNKRSIFVMKSISNNTCVSNVPISVILGDKGVL